MRHAFGISVVLGLTVGIGGSVAAAPVTVTGQVIDLYCYSRDNKATGMDHRDGRECALACIKWEGQPVGLLTADGKVYQLAGAVVAGNNAKVAPHHTHPGAGTSEGVSRVRIATV